MNSRSLQRLARRPRVFVALVFTPLALMCAAALYLTFKDEIPRNALTVSSPLFGQYQVLTETYLTYANQGESTLPFRVISRELESNGSKQTVGQLSRGEADIGIVQANTRENASNVYAIAYLFPEALFLLTVREVESPYRLHTLSERRPFRVATLYPGSQTHEDVNRIMTFYGYELQRHYVIVSGDYQEGLRRLQHGEAEVAVFISGLGNVDLRQVLQGSNGRIKLVPLVNIDAFGLHSPGYASFVIPQGFYGERFAEYRTVATRAMLVCGALDEDVVFDLTRDLFERRAQLQMLYPLLELAPVNEASDTFFPAHPGALRYHNRDRPGFIERHPAAIQLLVFCLTALGSIWVYCQRFKPRGSGDRNGRGRS